MFDPPAPSRWATPGDLARAVTPSTRQTPALDLVDQALVDVEEGRCDRLIINLSPQEGKSTRVTEIGPLWFLTRNPERRIAVVSYGQSLAERFGRHIREHITNNQGEEGTLDIGLRIAKDNGAVGAWQLARHRGGVRSVGMTGGLTGHPVDALFIDDPISNAEQADSETFRERHWQWWLRVGAPRLAPRAPVILVLTRWHEDDLAGRLLAAEDGHRWRVVSIPAQCEDPDTDPLGRELGEYMESARTWVDDDGVVHTRTREDWDAIKAQQSSRTWAALYQQHPTPAEGAVWKAPWIDTNRGKTGEVMHDLQRIVVSVDPAATSKKTSDLTGIAVTGMDSHRRGWVLDDRTLRGTPVEWGSAVWDAVLDWNATDVVVEDNQGGEMVLEVLNAAWREVTKRRPTRRLMPRIQRVNARQSKRTRAEAIAALYELGHVKHAADGTDRLSKLERQMLSWTGDGDSPDRVDALVHGLTALFQPQHMKSNPARAHGLGRWGAIRGR